MSFAMSRPRVAPSTSCATTSSRGPVVSRAETAAAVRTSRSPLCRHASTSAAALVGFGSATTWSISATRVSEGTAGPLRDRCSSAVMPSGATASSSGIGSG